MRRLSVWIDLIGMGQALAGHGPASGPASGARKRSGRTLQRPRPWWSSRNACEQFSAEMLESGQFPSRARSRAHSGVRRSPLVHWRLLTRLLHSPVVVWSWFCGIKISTPTLTPACPLTITSHAGIRIPLSREDGDPHRAHLAQAFNCIFILELSIRIWHTSDQNAISL